RLDFLSTKPTYGGRRNPGVRGAPREQGHAHADVARGGGEAPELVVVGPDGYSPLFFVVAQASRVGEFCPQQVLLLVRGMANAVFVAVRTVLAVREYQDKPIPDDVLRRIAEAGRLTASAGNRQPWQCVFVNHRQSLRELDRSARTELYLS